MRLMTVSLTKGSAPPHAGKSARARRRCPSCRPASGARPVRPGCPVAGHRLQAMPAAHSCSCGCAGAHRRSTHRTRCTGDWMDSTSASTLVTAGSPFDCHPLLRPLIPHQSPACRARPAGQPPAWTFAIGWAAATISRVGIPTMGSLRASTSPLANDKPTRRLVKDPGPMATPDRFDLVHLRTGPFQQACQRGSKFLGVMGAAVPKQFSQHLRAIV